MKKPVFDAEKLKKDQIEEIYIYLSQAYYKSEQYINAVHALILPEKKGVTVHLCLHLEQSATGKQIKKVPRSMPSVEVQSFSLKMPHF